jgi:hypothetical protein
MYFSDNERKYYDNNQERDDDTECRIVFNKRQFAEEIA